MLIEVLVSAIMIVLVAGAVLTLLIATTHSAASERTHSEAYALAQEDQARLRSMRISTLNRLQQTRSVTLNGSTFTIESTGLFVNNTTGTASCTTGASSADYVRITSTVTWPNMGARAPAVIQSIVSPSNGSLDPSHGTLTISATNAAGTPLAGVGISGTGAGTFSGSTDSNGCADFADLPSGNYTLTPTAAGLVDKNGNPPESKIVGVIPSSTVTVSLQYDRPGAISVPFKYRVGSSSEFKPAYADSVVVYNAEMTTAKAFWTHSGAREATVEATPLFPFTTPDTVYAGACEKDNPNPKSEVNSPGAAAMASVIVPAGEAAHASTIQLPALNLTVTYNGKPVSGARVTVTDINCKEAKGNLVKRIYTSNENGNQSATTNGAAEPGLPWRTMSAPRPWSKEKKAAASKRHPSRSKI